MERIQPFDFEYVYSVDQLKPMIPGPQSGDRYIGVDMMNPNKIIGYKSQVIAAFSDRGRALDTIDSLRYQNQLVGQDVRDGNAYKVQLKLNEVIAKLNEVSERNQILEERIVQLERQTISQNQHNTKRLTNVRERITRNRNGRNRTNRRRGLSREQGEAIAENILAR